MSTVQEVQDRIQESDNTHYPPRSIRLSDETWQALKDLRVLQNKFLSFEGLFSAMLDFIYLSRVTNPSDFKQGQWKQAKASLDKSCAGSIHEQIKTKTDKDGMIDSSEVTKIIDTYDSNPIKLPYKLS